MTTETSLGDGWTSNWFNAGVCFRQNTPKKRHFCFLCRRSCRWAKQHLSQDQFQPQVPPFLSQTGTHVNCQSGRRHISRNSNLLWSIKTFTLNISLWWEIWDEETSNASDVWHNREKQRKAAGANYGCNVSRRVKKKKNVKVIDVVQGLFPRNREREDTDNSPHFLLVKYESAAGSLKCRLYMVSAPAWKS